MAQLSDVVLGAHVCGNCRFFTAPVTEMVKIEGRENEYAGECDCHKFRKGYSIAPIEDDEVVVEDDEGWGFLVGPHFGCIHWIEKLLNP